MTFGVRKPSFKKSITAQSTGLAKRKIKSSVTPLYGKKGMGYIKDPKRAVYNKLYQKTTAGVNPLSDLGNHSSARDFKISQKNINTIGYIKKELIEKELVVTNRFEKWLRRILRKKTVETKVVKKNIITEQYTYGEIYSIQEEVNDALVTYNQCMRFLTDTSDPDVFFPRLNEADLSLLKAADFTRQHSFLINEGEDVVETHNRFVQEKENVIKQFVHTHFSHSLKGADALKTTRGKQNRLKSDYADLTVYFDDLSSSSIAMINSVWNTVVSTKDLIKNKRSQ